jgi:D-cysteine desulfhydrase
VLATGSGSTAAGLLTGLFRTPLRTRLLGVLAARNPAIRPIVLAQVLATARLRSIQVPLPEASARIDFETGQLGAGYGHPVEVGEDVKACAQRAGVVLDPTYTGKAFASALALARRNPSRRVLFWNTHSSVAPSSPARDTHLAELPPRLLQLLLPSSPEL